MSTQLHTLQGAAEHMLCAFWHVTVQAMLFLGFPPDAIFPALCCSHVS